MKKKIKRRMNYQKIFCFISFMFILVCILWYGGRFIYFYQDSKKTMTNESNTFARIVKTQNQDNENFKNVNQEYYFYGKNTNNYVSYSNLVWRIVKINEDNTILLITDNVIGSLAYGNLEDKYEDSNIIHWLNHINDNDISGVIEKYLNEKEKYLVKTSTCIDKIDDIEKVTCEKKNKDFYLGLLSIQDYIHTGGNNGFIANERYSYMANKNKDNEIWYINEDGKLDVSNGETISGIKATITLSPNLELKSGTGTQDDPYKFEDSTSILGSYIKLGEDTWRVYEEQDNIIKLISQDTILTDEKTLTNQKKTSSTSDINNDDKLEYSYASNSYYHNDTKKGSLAYYLNHTYYDSLSYKDLILENTYANGFYGSDSNYDYQNIMKNTIETKVALPSISDILLNDTLSGYFTDTGTSETSSFVYIRKEKGAVSSKNVTSEAYVVPCISIQRDNLKAGSGNIEDPYRTE